MFIGICILSFIRISLSVHPHFRMRMPLCELQIRFSLLPNYKFGRTGLTPIHLINYYLLIAFGDLSIINFQFLQCFFITAFQARIKVSSSIT